MMKLSIAPILAITLGIFVYHSSFSAGASESSYSIPSFPQDKTNGGDNDEEDSVLNSGGEISGEEIICSEGTPSTIGNESSPDGSYDDLLMIRWEKRTIMGEWTVIPSATVLTYSPETIFETTQYRRGCRGSIEEPWQYSNVITKRIIQGIEEVKIMSINTTCKGGGDGYAIANVIGGTPGYEYEWSVPEENNNEIHELSAGSYSVIVTDANGCTSREEFEITEPSSSVAIHNVYPLEPFCPGEPSGAIFVEAWDGVPPYAFTWSNGNTNSFNVDIPAGTYDVTVEDALGCKHTISDIELTEPDPFILEENSFSVTCFGDSDGETELKMNGGTAPYEYIWEDGYWSENREELEAGTYELAVLDLNNCLSMHEIQIESPDSINPEMITLDNKICKASINMVPTGGTAPYSYEWNDGDTQGYKSNLCPGIYTVLVTDAKGCKKEESLEIRAEYAIRSIDIEILVNPFNKEGNVIISLPYDQPADIEIYSLSGQLVEAFYDKEPETEKEINIKLNLNKYSNSVYLVNVRSAGIHQTEKVIVTN